MHLNYVSAKRRQPGFEENRCHLKSEGSSSNLGREIFVNIFYLKFYGFCLMCNNFLVLRVKEV